MGPRGRGCWEGMYEVEGKPGCCCGASTAKGSSIKGRVSIIAGGAGRGGGAVQVKGCCPYVKLEGGGGRGGGAVQVNGCCPYVGLEEGGVAAKSPKSSWWGVVLGPAPINANALLLLLVLVFDAGATVDVAEAGAAPGTGEALTNEPKCCQSSACGAGPVGKGEKEEEARVALDWPV